MRRKWIVSFILLVPGSAYAAGCESYPKGPGIDPVAMSEGKWVSTGSAEVNFDDVGSVNDARQEATLKAKAAIAEALSNSVKRNELIEKSVNESVNIKNDEKEKVKNTLKKQSDTISSSAEAVLRGAFPIADCYTKGSEVRVTVAVKPETIKAAEDLAGKMNTSMSAVPNPTNGPARAGAVSPVPSASGNKLQGVDSFNNSDALSKF